MLESLYKSQSDDFTKQFQRIYLNYLNNQPNTKIFYNLTFNHFNVTTNTMESTLLDYN